jgi:hypothetical protein
MENMAENTLEVDICHFDVHLLHTGVALPETDVARQSQPIGLLVHPPGHALHQNQGHPVRKTVAMFQSMFWQILHAVSAHSPHL